METSVPPAHGSEGFNLTLLLEVMTLVSPHNPNYKDGEQLRDFIYVKDITRWMIELLNKKTCTSGIYNMGFGKARTWLSLAEEVFKQLERPVNIEWIDVPNNIRNQYQYFTEAKVNRLLGQGLSHPQWPLEKGIEDYLKNYLLSDHPHLR